VVFVVAILVAASCSSPTEDVAPVPTVTATAVVVVTPTVEPQPTPPTPDASIEAYFGALVARSVGGFGEAAAASLPGSVAWQYALHRQAVQEVLGVGPAGTLQVTATEAEICAPDGGGCTAYDGFDIDPVTGLLISFVVNGESIGGRLARDGAVAGMSAVTGHMVSAYQAIGGTLSVVVELHNGAQEVFRPFGFAAGYHAPGSRTGLDASAAFGPDTIEAGGTARLLVSFEGVGPGGRLELTGIMGPDAREINLDIAIESAP
jgi:hypothetical protein